MAVLTVNLSSERTSKAHVAKLMTRPVVMLLAVTAVTLGVAGVGLVMFGAAIGWLLFGLAAVPAMFVEWYNGELKTLPADKGRETVDAFLESSILAGLQDHASPSQVAELVGKSQAGQFMAVRFGVTANFLMNIANEDVKLTDDLWVEVRELQRQTDSPLMHGGVVAAALIRQFPDYEMLLAQMHL